VTAHSAAALLQRGRLLEVATLGWNVVGIAVLTVAAIGAGSVAPKPTPAERGRLVRSHV
jgi:hypothetical protein